MYAAQIVMCGAVTPIKRTFVQPLKNFGSNSRVPVAASCPVEVSVVGLKLMA